MLVSAPEAKPTLMTMTNNPNPGPVPNPGDNHASNHASNYASRDMLRAVRRLTRILALLLPPIAASLISLATPNPAFLGFGFFVALTVGLYILTALILIFPR